MNFEAFNENTIFHEVQFDLQMKPKPFQKCVYVVGRPEITLSSEYIDLMNTFGNMGGFDKMIELASLRSSTLRKILTSMTRLWHIQWLMGQGQKMIIHYEKDAANDETFKAFFNQVVNVQRYLDRIRARKCMMKTVQAQACKGHQERLGVAKLPQSQLMQIAKYI